MIPAQKILDRMQHSLNTEVDFFERKIDEVLDKEKSIPDAGIQIRVGNRLSKEAADVLAKMYFAGGWQFAFRYENKTELSPGTQCDTEEIFVATIINLKVATV